MALPLALGVLTPLLLGAVACAPHGAPAANGPGGGEAEAEATGEAGDASGGSSMPLPTEPGAELREVSATVQQVGQFGWGLVPDAEPGTRYAVEELPEELREDGLEVVFSGVLGEIPANVRLWGTPLELTSIRRAADSP
ncbi:MAG: hypothetical protein SX243_11015 [Acidobacteriota bacterium]|nr:hypothetical protein [Acidobacteriota bacterium]